MIINLSKDDLVNLVTGISPPHSLMDKLQSRGLGSYTGGFHDKWDWNRHSLSDLFEYELFEIYTEYKEALKSVVVTEPSLSGAELNIKYEKTKSGVSWSRKES